MEQMIEELAVYYAALGFPMYAEAQLREMSEEELKTLYDLTFPNHE